jgi:large subunit ribosomal protein L17
MLSNMACALVKHEQIKTTLPKARELRPYIEKMVSRARGATLHDRRLLFSVLRDDAIVEKLITTLADRYKDRPGGYTRIIKAGFRYGDAAPLAYIEFVDRDINAKGQDSGPNQNALSQDDLAPFDQAL